MFKKRIAAIFTITKESKKAQSIDTKYKINP